MTSGKKAPVVRRTVSPLLESLFGTKLTLCHAQEPAQREKTREVLHRDDQHRHAPKGEHHGREHAAWAIFLADDGQKWCCQNVRDKEDAQDRIILVCSEHAQIPFQTVGLRIAEICFVQRVEQIHHAQDRKNAKVEFPDQATLSGGIDGVSLAIDLNLYAPFRIR